MARWQGPFFGLPRMTSRLVVVGLGVKGERNESRVTEAQRRPLPPGPKTTLLNQPGEAKNPTTA
jgi:hypothetical protein